MKNIIKLLSVVCSVLILSGCVLVVNAATTATEPVSQNVTIPEDYQFPDTNVDGADNSALNSGNIDLNDKDLKVGLDKDKKKVTISSDIFDMLDKYNTQTTNEEEALKKGSEISTILNNIDFSDLSGSLSNFDESDGVLNFSFVLLASSLSKYQENTSLSKVDKNADIFEKGYSENITQYFESSFGDLSSKKDLSLDELPSMSSYTKQADKKRNAGMKSFLNSSTYKSVNSMVNVGDIFSSAKSQLNGGGKYSLPSIGSLQSSISGAAAGLDNAAKGQQSADYNSNYNANLGAYRDDRDSKRQGRTDLYNNLKQGIKDQYETDDLIKYNKDNKDDQPTGPLGISNNQWDDFWASGGADFSKLM